MSKHNQDGHIDSLLIPLVLVSLLLIAALGFAGWAYSGKQDYKNNVDAKVSAAVTIAKQQESTEKDTQFAQAEKNPLRTYTGPEALGSLVVLYPKTWSNYVSTSGSNGSQLDGFANPQTVPTATDPNSTFALRYQVIGRAYSSVLADFRDRQQSGKITVAPYALPKVPSAIGVRVEGSLTTNHTVSMVVLPLRDKTIEVWTEGAQYISDFNNIILPNFSFSP
ncbi:MAG: hypothetical protein JWN38_1204 [Candidatus Saccharibacteria bacterium]|nr:hypothetical protein [Candidatus Saccharibacteria bacterium]